MHASTTGAAVVFANLNVHITMAGKRRTKTSESLSGKLTSNALNEFRIGQHLLAVLQDNRLARPVTANDERIAPRAPASAVFVIGFDGYPLCGASLTIALSRGR